MTRHMFVRMAAAIAVTGSAFTAQAAPPPDLNDILRRYVDDYKSDPMLVDAHFGIQIGADWWTVSSKKGANGGANQVMLTAGPPKTPTWHYVIESGDVLRQLDRGQVTFGTLAGKAQPSDKVPMDVAFMPGFTPDARTPGGGFYEAFTAVSFHFWYRGNPEVVPFGSQELRVIHGVYSTALYYQPGLRTIWFSIRRGQHANRNGDGVGPWKKVMVFTNGAGKAKIGDRIVDVKAGDRLFVPPRAINEFWNEGVVPLEGVLLIFGEGA